MGFRHETSRRVLCGVVFAASSLISGGPAWGDLFVWSGAASTSSPSDGSTYGGLFGGNFRNYQSDWNEGGLSKLNWTLNGIVPSSLPGVNDTVAFGSGFDSGNPYSRTDRNVGELLLTTPESIAIDFREADGTLRALGIASGRVTRTAGAGGSHVFRGQMVLPVDAVFDISGSPAGSNLIIWDRAVFAGSLTKTGNAALYLGYAPISPSVVAGNLQIDSGSIQAWNALVNGTITVGDGVGSATSAVLNFNTSTIALDHSTPRITIRSDGDLFFRDQMTAPIVDLGGRMMLVGLTGRQARLVTQTLNVTPYDASNPALLDSSGDTLVDFSGVATGTINLLGASNSSFTLNSAARMKAQHLLIRGAGKAFFVDSATPGTNDIQSTTIESGDIFIGRAEAYPLGQTVTVGMSAVTTPASLDSSAVWGPLSQFTLHANGTLFGGGSTVTSVTFVDGGTISESMTVTSATTSMTGSVGVATIDAVLNLPATHTFSVNTGATLKIADRVNGTTLSKTSGGTLTLGNGARLSVSTLNLVSGTLSLAHTDSGSPFGVDPTITIGNLNQVMDTPTMRWDANGDLSPTAVIQLRSGTIDLNGYVQAISGLNVSGVGSQFLNTGAGTLTLLGNSTLNLATFLQVNGNLDLNGGTRTFNAAGATGDPSFANALIKGTLNNGTLSKSGVGAIYLNTLTGNATVDVDQGTLRVGVATIGGLTGDATTDIEGTLTVNVATGVTTTYNGSLVGTGKLVKTGNGKLVLGGTTNTLVGGVELTTGTLDVAAPTALGAAPPKLANFRLLSLAVPGASAARFTHGPSTLSSFSHIDTGDDGLIVDYSGTSPVSTYRALVNLKRNGGAWNEIGGLFSSLVLTDPSRISMGVIEASAIFSGPGPFTWRGQQVDGSTLLISVALKGDTNLDRAVNFNDLLALARNYETGVTGKFWSQGDFDFNGTTDFNDLLALARNYNGSLLADAASLDVGGSSFAVDLALAQSLVPEPAFAGLAALTLALRRRR